MCELITRAGAHAFLALTLEAAESRLIDAATLRGRLFALRELIDGDWNANDPVIEHDLSRKDRLENDATRDDLTVSAGGGPSAKDDQLATMLHLVLSQDPDLRVWTFHLGDDDPYPSVPHGHYTSSSLLKLDVYRGYTVEKGKPVSRVSRNDIARLWNYDVFRAFARRALDHFILGHPAYHFRVSNPRHLPRKRRK